MLERNSAQKVGGEVYISLHQANLCLENAICATTCKADCYQKRAPGKRNVWISRYPQKIMVCCARYAKMVIKVTHFLAKAGAGILPTFDSCQILALFCRINMHKKWRRGLYSTLSGQYLRRKCNLRDSLQNKVDCYQMSAFGKRNIWISQTKIMMCQICQNGDYSLMLNKGGSLKKRR